MLLMVSRRGLSTGSFVKGKEREVGLGSLDQVWGKKKKGKEKSHCHYQLPFTQKGEGSWRICVGVR